MPWPAPRETGSPAIVSDRPGTTRDYLTADLDLDGVKCQLIDTAGIDDVLPESDAATVEEPRRKCRRSRSARPMSECCVWKRARSGEREWSEERSAWREQESDDRLIVVQTKCDLSRRAAVPRPLSAPSFLETSAVTGLGIQKLKEAIRAAALRAAGPRSTWWRARPCGAASRCDWRPRRLNRAREAVHAGLGEELIAAEVRLALSELGKVAGAVYTDDLLDRIFSRFCIGK